MKKSLKNILLFVAVFIFSTSAASAIEVTVYGSGGAVVTYQDGKTIAKICPNQADKVCCKIAINGDDIKVISENYWVPEDLHEENNQWHVLATDFYQDPSTGETSANSLILGKSN